MKIYPNPSNGVINVSFNVEKENDLYNGSLVIYNKIGEQIYIERNINISNNYFIELKNSYSGEAHVVWFDKNNKTVLSKSIQIIK